MECDEKVRKREQWVDARRWRAAERSSAHPEQPGGQADQAGHGSDDNERVAENAGKELREHERVGNETGLLRGGQYKCGRSRPLLAMTLVIGRA